MVGVGGEIPSKVKLGDVVIGTLVDDYQGVVQWQSGRKEKGGVFRYFGGLNAPPSALLTALTKLESRSRLNGYKISQYLEYMGKRWPTLVPEYTQPPTSKDHRVVSDGPFAWRAIGTMLWKLIIALFWNILGLWMFSLKASGLEQEVNDYTRQTGEIKTERISN